MNPARLIKLPGVLSVVTQDGPVDETNDPTEQIVTADVLCWYEQATADDDTGGTNQQTETHRLYFRDGVTVTGYDHLAVDGHRFQILGPPWPAKNPRTGVVEHIEAKGREVT